jgi:hypothetical protein
MKDTKTLVRNEKIPDSQLKDFILQVVNTTDRLVDGSDDYIAQKYRQFFPTRDRDIQLLAGMLSWFSNPNHPDPNDPFDRKEAGGMLCRGVIGGLRNRLRAVWLAGNENAAEWRLFKLQAHMHGRTNLDGNRKRHLHPPSPDTPIELAIDWVRRNLLTLRVCRNPECLSPLFVADRAQRRFCLSCVSVSQKAHKRRWWRERKRLPEEPKMKAGAMVVPEKRSVSASPESERRWKQFLHDIVNAHKNDFDYILKKYANAGFLPSKTISERAFAAFRRNELIGKYYTDDKLIPLIHQEKQKALNKLRQGLRSIWSADDDYTAQWRLFSLQDQVSADPEMYDSGVDSQPPPSDRLVYQAFGYLQRKLHMLRTCENPDCETLPFFIADKSRQTHCSDGCAALAQSKYKTRWWKEKGPEWRKATRPKPKKSRRPLRKSR